MPLAEPASDLRPGGQVERMAYALARSEGERFYPAADANSDALWADHWAWYLRGRGKGGSADYSNQARWERMARAALAQIAAPRPRAEYHEDLGPVLWWRFPVSEPPYVGQPTCDDWPGYHTHWTPLVIPPLPEAG